MNTTSKTHREAAEARAAAAEEEEEDEEEEEEEEEEEKYIPARRVRAPIAPPKQFNRKQKPSRVDEDELYSNASIAMLRNKLQEQTRQRLFTDLFY